MDVGFNGRRGFGRGCVRSPRRGGAARAETVCVEGGCDAREGGWLEGCREGVEMGKEGGRRDEERDFPGKPASIDRF